MKTFVVIQLIFASISFSFGSLYEYHVPNIGAQLIMMIFNVFPFEQVRLLGLGTLALASVSTFFVGMISFIRAWRYIFFPSKEHFQFFLQCVGLIPLVVVQLVFYLYQYHQLVQKKKPKYEPKLFMNAIYIMFLHDFIYSALFLSGNGLQIFMGYSQFIVHSAMMILNRENEKQLVKFYCILWTGLLVQHIFTLTQFFADTSMYNTWFVFVFTSVYIVANVLYLLNGVLLYETNK